MIGKLFGTAIRIVTLPIDAVNAGIDIASGGDGSKDSRTEDYNPLGMLEDWRDRIAETAEDMDD